MARGPRDDEDGFSIIETAIALGVVFTVILGLLASLNVGISGLLTGRQRSGAIAVAKEVIENARSVPFRDVGHDMDDPGLVEDPAVTGTKPDFSYEPSGASGPERLVAAVDPHFPSHRWIEMRDGATYEVRVYVTWVHNLVGDDHKRVTVMVAFTPEQFDPDVVENVVRLSSFMSRGGQSFFDPSVGAGPTSTSGNVDVEVGTLGVTGALSGVDLTAATVFFPLVHGDMTSQILRRVHGLAQSSRSELVVGSGTLSGCEVEGSMAVCSGINASTVVDNDGGTPAPVHDVDGPHSTSAPQSVVAGPLAVVLGATNSVVSRGTVSSCLSCAPAVGDDDGLPYSENEATGPSSVEAVFEAGILTGTLAQGSSGGTAWALIDPDPVVGGERVRAQGRIVAGAMDLVSIDPTDLDLPAGFTAAARVGSVDVTATAEAGPTAASPSISGSSVVVELFDTDALGLLGYRTVTITPGQAFEDSASAVFEVIDLLTLEKVTVTVETTVAAGDGRTSCAPDCTSIERAEAELSNWLRVSVRFVVTSGTSILADLTVERDYGRVVVSATHEVV